MALYVQSMADQLHSRLLIASTAAYVTTSPVMVATFRSTCNEYGLPVSVLSDNGAVFTARMRNGGNAFETEMASLKIVQKTPVATICRRAAKSSASIRC